MFKRLNLNPQFSNFSSPLELVNYDSNLKVQGTDNPSASDLNFRPYKSIYRHLTLDYAQLK